MPRKESRGIEPLMVCRCRLPANHVLELGQLLNFNRVMRRFGRYFNRLIGLEISTHALLGRFATVAFVLDEAAVLEDADAARAQGAFDQLFAFFEHFAYLVFANLSFFADHVDHVVLAKLRANCRT